MTDDGDKAVAALTPAGWGAYNESLGGLAGETALPRRRSLAIRHVSGHRLVALIEIISPANKDRTRHVEDFVAKALAALELGVHLLLVDLFPPGPFDPSGLHGALRQGLEPSNE